MLMARWKSIKETFQDNINRVNDSKRRSSGNGTDDGYKPRWKLWPKMNFMHKTCVVAPSVSNIPTPTQSSNSSQMTQEDFTCEDDLAIGTVYYDDSMGEYFTIPPETPSSESVLSLSLEESSDTSSSLVISRPSSAPSANAIIGNSILQARKPTSASLNAIPFHKSSAAKNSTPSSSCELYSKRGANKRKAGAALEECMQIVKDLAKEPDLTLPPIAAPDAVDTFASFVASRLRSMNETQRKQCEDQLLGVIMKY